MSKNEIINKLKSLNGLLDKLSFVPALLARISIGYVFVNSGWGKFGKMDQVIGFFQSIGIPMAEIQAPVISGIELFGGIALIIGLGTRYFSVLLTGIMAVALMTAHAADVGGLSDLFKMYQFMYILLLGYFITQGAGKLSVDSMLKGKI